MGNYIPAQVDLSSLSFNYLQRGQDWADGSNVFEQSPIDIIPEQAVPSNDSMKFELFLSDQEIKGLTVRDTGASLQVTAPVSKLYSTDIDGEVYDFEAIQFHFHAPSEHTVNEGFYDLELHIVHHITPESQAKGTTNRNLAVVGVFFKVDDSPNAVPDPFLEALRLHEIGAEFSLNMNDVFKNRLKSLMTFYAYKGSLTVPPCSANANWYVIEEPLLCTREQMEHFDLRWKDNPHFANGHGNNRPVQPLYGRTVMKSNNCCIQGTSQEGDRKLLRDRHHSGTDLMHEVMHDHDHPTRESQNARPSQKSGSYYSKQGSFRGSMHSKDLPKEMTRLGSFYSKGSPAKSGSVYFKDFRPEVAMLRAKSSLEDSGSREGSFSSPDKARLAAIENLALQRSESINQNKIPLDILKFGSCFASESPNNSRGGSMHSRESPIVKTPPAEDPNADRVGTTLYSKQVPAEISNLLKQGLNLDEDH